MNASGKRSRPLLIFYLLVAYIIIQFSWWTYSMFRLNNEIRELKTELILLKNVSPEQIIVEGTEFNTRLHKRWVMISGEGAVFIALLLLGIVRIRKTFRQEQELATRQKNFLLSVTHELKSPIASTKLQLQTLQKHELPREKQLGIISNAISDADRLNNLVENILLAAKIENGVYEPHREELDISEYILQGMKQTIDSFNYSHEVILSIQPGIRMKIDKTNFPSIILNLFENAVKYSPAGSRIEISLKQNKDSIQLAISDQGKGIGEQDKKNIFDRFYRIGNEETRSAKGTGLGLYIAKYLAEQHGGTISVKNNQPRGSIFEVTFPRTK